MAVRVKEYASSSITRADSRLEKTQEVSVVPLSFWQFGEVYQFGGEYWGKHCNVSGRLEYITLGKAGYVATLSLRGTDNPDLKQWSESCHASGYPPEITVHLCPVGCPKHGMSTGGIRGLTVVKEDSSAPWALNVAVPSGLEGAGGLEKELADLSRLPAKEVPQTSQAVVTSDMDVRTSIKKGSATYEGGPLDPHQSVRRILKKRKKKGKKKSRKDKKRSRAEHSSHSSRSSESMNSSSGVSLDSQDSGHPFKEGHRVKQLAKKHPGLLTRHALGRDVSTVGTACRRDERSESVASIPEVFAPSCDDARDVRCPKAGIGHPGYRSRSFDSKRHSGRIRHTHAEDKGHRDGSWRNLELVPLESEKLTSVAEAQGAVREFRQDWKAKRKGAALEGKERGMAQGRLERGQDTSCKSGANQTLPMKGGDRADGPIFSTLDRDSLPGGAPMAGASTSRPDLVSQIQDWLQLPCDSLCLSAVVLNGILGSVDCGLSHLVLHSSGVEEETTAGEKAQRKRDLFPLPLPGKSALQKHVDEKDYARVWLYLVVSGLNYLHAGRHGSVTIGNPSPIQRQILEYLEGRVRVFLKHRFDVERFDWSKFLSTRTLSYGGEEVRTAKWTTWANLEPALPYGAIGKIPAVDLAEGGVLDALRHPEKYLKPGWESTRVRSSRVMVEESQWPELCRGLVRYNLVSIIPHSAVARAGGQLVLNGLFGVEKGELCEGVCVHRLIMNLIPYNSLCLNVEGDVGTLPLLHQMNALQLHPHEDMIISSEDVRCFFYVFSLPESWLPFLTFNKPVPSDLVPPGVDEPCYLAAKVLPMGFLNSVGIAQHLHRNFLSRVQGSPSRVLGYSEIRKDRSFTLSNPAWRVYLDNLDVLEKVSPSLVPLLEGRVSDDVSPLIAAYQQTGIPLNPKKSVNQQSRAEMQGADIDGVEGTGRPKAEKLGKYVSAALSLLRKGSCSQKEIRIVAGGLVYFSMFRRPLMSCLNYVWQFIQSFEEQRVGRLAMPRAVKSELFMFLCLLPLGHFDFRAPCSDIATASDASMLGGGVCASDGVTQFGASVAALPFRGKHSTKSRKVVWFA